MDFIKEYKLRPEDDFYALLGCDELSSSEQIIVEYRSRVLTCHPDKHPDNAEKKEEFQRLLLAKETLCNSTSREKYDRWRRSKLAIPYEEFERMGEHVHMTMHWASPKKEAMLEPKPLSSSSSSRFVFPPPNYGDASGKNDEVTLHGAASIDHEKVLTTPNLKSTKENPTGWISTPAPPGSLLHKFRSYQI